MNNLLSSRSLQIVIYPRNSSGQHGGQEGKKRKREKLNRGSKLYREREDARTLNIQEQMIWAGHG